jgi:hypothetical protein
MIIDVVEKSMNMHEKSMPIIDEHECHKIIIEN